MFIISLEYIKSLEEVDKHIHLHISYLKKYYKDGIFILSGRKVPRTGGIIIAHCSSHKEIWDIIKKDPFYCASIAKYEITEFIPTMATKELKSLMQIM